MAYFKKTLLVIALLFIVVLCNGTNKIHQIDLKIEVSHKTTKKLNNDSIIFVYPVTFTIVNNTDSTISFWTFSCSWQLNAVFSPQDVYLYYWGCDANFPVHIYIKPHKKHKFNGELSILDYSRIQKEGMIKVGFLLLEKAPSYDFIHLIKEKIKKNENILWSNQKLKIDSNNDIIIAV